MELRFVGGRVRGDRDTLSWRLRPRYAGKAGVPAEVSFRLDGAAVRVELPSRWDEGGTFVVTPPPGADDVPIRLPVPAGTLGGRGSKLVRRWAEEAASAGHDVTVAAPGDAEGVTSPLRGLLRGPAGGVVVTGGILVGLYLALRLVLGIFYAGDIEAASGFAVSVDGNKEDEAVVATYFERFDEVADGAGWLDDIGRAMVRAASNDVTIYTTLDDRAGLEAAREICYAALEAGADDVHVWGDKAFTDTRLDGTTETQTVTAEIIESTAGVCRNSQHHRMRRAQK